MTPTLLEAPTDLNRLRSETPFVEAQAALTQAQVEEARRSYQRGGCTLPELVQAEQLHTADLALVVAHTAALTNLEKSQAQQAKAERIAALKASLQLNRETRAEAMSTVLNELEQAEEELHAARFEVRRVRQVVESALTDAGRQDLAELTALEGRPSPAVAPLVTLEERREYDTLLDTWMLSSGDSMARMDDTSLFTPSDAVEVEFNHRNRWTAVLGQLALLRGR